MFFHYNTICIVVSDTVITGLEIDKVTHGLSMTGENLQNTKTSWHGWQELLGIEERTFTQVLSFGLGGYFEGTLQSPCSL